MREFRTYGSVRGAPSNGRPYRNNRLNANVVRSCQKGITHCQEKSHATILTLKDDDSANATTTLRSCVRAAFKVQAISSHDSSNLPTDTLFRSTTYEAISSAHESKKSPKQFRQH